MVKIYISGNTVFGIIIMLKYVIVLIRNQKIEIASDIIIIDLNVSFTSCAQDSIARVQ